MSTKSQFSPAGIRKRATPFLSVDQKFSHEFEGLPRQLSTIEPGKEADILLADDAHLKQEYLFLVERTNMLEAENINLRLTVQFYQDLCLYDCP